MIFVLSSDKVVEIEGALGLAASVPPLVGEVAGGVSGEEATVVGVSCGRVGGVLVDG